MVQLVKKLLKVLIFYILIAYPCTAYAQWDDANLSEFEVIEQRNIFRFENGGKASSGEQSMAQTVNADAAVSLDDLTVTGIIKIKGRYKAILERKGSQKGFYVTKDDIVDPYVVKNITKEQVVLTKDDQKFILQLQGKAISLPPPLPKKEEQKTPFVEEKKVEKPISKKRNPNIMQRLRMGVR